MLNAAGGPEIIHFGEDFAFDVRARRLTRAGRAVRLERIPAEILLLLLERPGQLVTRQEIVDSVWGQGVFLDTDNSINGAIRKIRQVLRDDAEEPRFVETITGRGYRFIAAVRFPEGPSAAPVVAPAEPAAVEPPPTISATGAAAPPRRLFIVLAPLLVGVIGASWLLWFREPSPPPASRERITLAVLPFANLTGDPAQDYFSDGLTEEMISRLGNLDPDRLRVIARTSVMQYKGQSPAPGTLARDLGAGFLLEGSVRRDSGRVRINAQLVQASDQTQLWSRQFDRELSSLLTLQEEIAQAVATEIELTLRTGSAGTRAGRLSTTELEAYDVYLKGRYSWNKRTHDGFKQAIGYFEEATRKDPGYARAFAGLADSYALMSTYGLGPATELMPKARAAARRALELNDQLAEAHTSLALITLAYEWDWKTAETEYRRAIALDPNYATAHQWYAECLGLQGRFEEAFVESERARQLDPLSLIIATDHAVMLYYARQYDKAIAQFRAVLSAEPSFGRAHMIEYAFAQKGMYQEALTDIREWRRLTNSHWSLGHEAYVVGHMGKPAEARRLMQRFEEANTPAEASPHYMRAVAFAGIGDRDRAIAALQQGLAERLYFMGGIKVDPAYDPVRDAPRFQELLRRIRLYQQE